jgi:sugar phosphate isomerase/epimerase
MPMDRKLYPKDWSAIAYRIKERANWCCEECRRPCRRSGESLVEFFNRLNWNVTIEEKWGRYVLTVAHLNHIPSDCSDENLKALCTGCHLRYDNSQRAIKRRLKRERLGQLTINFEEG